MNGTVWYLELSLALPFFVIRMKTALFQSCGHGRVFQICWHVEYSTLTASSFRILNSSAGISSPPLALFVVMLPKAHLTSHSRMSSSRCVTTPSWFSGSLRPFLYSSSVYYCHFFLISSASVRSLLFLFFIVPILTWNVPFMVLVTASYTVLRTSACSSSYTLPNLVPWIYLSPPLYNHKGCDLGHTWMV